MNLLVNSPSILEWILMGLGATALVIYIVISIKKTNKKKKKKEDPIDYE